MPYPRPESAGRRLAEREQTILDAAQSIASESGMGAVQIAPVAHRADIAAGTVYRYFPSKNNLIAEVIASDTRRAPWRQGGGPPMLRRGRFRPLPPAFPHSRRAP